ncbi:TniQ family protein [Streptomyces kaempferi]
MSPVQRWPLLPQPGPLESLSSWLNRLADLYEMPVKELLTRNLGLVDLAVPADLDYDPTMTMLHAAAPPCAWSPMGPSSLSAASPPRWGQSTGTSTTATGPHRTAVPGRRSWPRWTRPSPWRARTETPPGSS